MVLQYDLVHCTINIKESASACAVVVILSYVFFVLAIKIYIGLFLIFHLVDVVIYIFVFIILSS